MPSRDGYPVVLSILGVVLGCSGHVTPRAAVPQPGQRTAVSLVSYEMSAPGALMCTARFRWEWQPRTLADTVGRRTRLSVPPSGFDHVEAVPYRDGEAVVCLFTNSSGPEGLAPGVWTITVHTIYGPEAQCDVTLRAGRNLARFRQGSPTCLEESEVAISSPD